MENDVLDQLYQRYAASTLLYCLSLCGDKALAEDLLADAFVKAYLTLPKECPNFQFWLLRVCKNLWLDHLRRQKHFTPDGLSDTLPAPDTPETQFFSNERRRALWNALATLSPPDRELVTLHYFSGLPLQEIARFQDRSYAAVRQRLSRLRHILRQRMEEQGYDF